MVFSRDDDPGPEALAESTAAMADSAAADLARLLPELEEQIVSVGAIQVLAHFALYGLATFDGTNRREWTEEAPCYQHHVEMLQALALRRPQGLDEDALVPPPRFGPIFENVRQLTMAFTLQRLSAVNRLPADGATRETAAARLRVAESIRSGTQAIRNPGYGHQLRDVLTRLTSPLDAAVEEVNGVTVTGVVGMWFELVRLIERRATDHSHWVKGFFRAKKPVQAAAAYSAGLPDAPLVEDVLAAAAAAGAEGEDLRWYLVALADRSLWRVYTLSLDDFVAAYLAGLPQGTVSPSTDRLRADLRRIVETWSLKFGELGDARPEHLFLDNPVWRRPFVRLSETHFFLPIPALFFGFAFELIEPLFAASPAIKERYERRRATFLEEDVARLFTEALPGAQVFRSTLWTDPESGREYENDILVVLDSHALVIEAKAGRVSDSARRGAPDRLRRVVTELLADSAEQARRFASYLASRPGAHRLHARSGSVHEFDTSKVRYISPLAVTLDALAIGGMPLRLLKEAALLPADDFFVPAMNAYDLRCVVELLSEPATLLHYLSRRSDVEREYEYHGDETDLLGYYLETGFNEGVPPAPDGERLLLVLTGHDQLIEPWFVAQYRGQRRAKPQPRRTPWFRDVIARLGTTRQPGWSGAAHALLDVSHEDQRKFGEGFDLLRRRRRRVTGRGSSTPDYVMLAYGPPQRMRALVGIPLTHEMPAERAARVRRIAGEVAADYPDRVVVGIGRDCAEGAPPYSFIGVLRQGAGPA